MTCRDWSATLFPASWKGVPFHVESDEESGGRRLVVHQFPMRDEPFVEDLGQDQRGFEVTAYIASDLVDVQALALMAAGTSRGAGMLVLPMQGPAMAHCKSVKRSRERDKNGYVAFSLTFVRAGQAGALATVSSLAQAVFDAAGGVAGLIGGALAVATVTRGLVSTVSAAATDDARSELAVFEAIRAATPINPVASATLRDALGGLYDLAPLAFAHRDPGEVATQAVLATPRGTAAAALADAPTTVAGWGRALVEAARTLADGLPPEEASRALRDVLREPPVLAEGGATPARQAISANAAAIANATRLAALTALAEASVRREYAARPDAISARAEVAELIEREQTSTVGAATAELYVALENLRGLVASQLTRRIIDLAPIMTVQARVSMPSLWWAWRIHKDPLRATELVARNGVPAPAFMPLAFEALADLPASAR